MKGNDYLLVVAGALASAATWLALQAQRADNVDWAASLQSAAADMRVELTEECMAELRAYIDAYGFDRGAVTMHGVLIRNLAGEHQWLCVGR